MQSYFKNINTPSSDNDTMHVTYNLPQLHNNYYDFRFLFNQPSFSEMPTLGIFWICAAGVLQARCQSCHSTNSIKTLQAVATIALPQSHSTAKKSITHKMPIAKH